MTEKNPVLPSMFFDPHKHPDATLKAFDEFAQSFELRYDAMYPEPPRGSMEMAISRWKLQQEDKTKEPDLNTYDAIRDTLREKDKVTKRKANEHSTFFIALYQTWSELETNE